MAGRFLPALRIVVRARKLYQKGLGDLILLPDIEGAELSGVDPAQNRVPAIAGQVADLQNAQYLGKPDQSGFIVGQYCGCRHLREGTDAAHQLFALYSS